MQEDYTVFNIPRAAQAEPAVFDKPAYDTDDYLTHERRKDDKTSSIYDELNKIAEELEKCRLRNC